MYLREVLDKAVLSTEIEEGNDLVLVDPSIVGWCDVPMIVRREDWEAVFVSLRSKEPDIEVVGAALTARKDKELLAFIANREEVSSRYQQLQIALKNDAAKETEAPNTGEDIEVKREHDYVGMTAGISDGMGVGMADSMRLSDISEKEIPHPTGPVGTTIEQGAPIRLTPDSVGEMTGFSLDSIVSHSAFNSQVDMHQTPQFGQGVLEDEAPPEQGSGEEQCASAEPEPSKEPMEEPKPLGLSALIKPEREGTAASEADNAAPQMHAEADNATTQTHAEPEPEPEAEPDIEKPAEPEPVESSGEEGPADSDTSATPEEEEPVDEYAGLSERYGYNVEEVLQALAVAFSRMRNDFDEICQTVTVTSIITTSYPTVDDFITVMREALAPDFEALSDVEDLGAWMALLDAIYNYCSQLIIDGEKEQALKIYQLLSALIYEEG